MYKAFPKRKKIAVRWGNIVILYCKTIFTLLYLHTWMLEYLDILFTFVNFISLICLHSSNSLRTSEMAIWKKNGCTNTGNVQILWVVMTFLKCKHCYGIQNKLIRARQYLEVYSYDFQETCDSLDDLAPSHR